MDCIGYVFIIRLNAMKRFLRFIFIFLPLILIVLIGISINRKQKLLRSIAERIGTLPHFSFPDLSGKEFSSSEISEGPVLIMRFHPECEHCQFEIAEILESGLPHSYVRFIMITSAPFQKITDFAANYRIDTVPNLYVLVDTAFIFGHLFGHDYNPSFYVYDRDLKLKQVNYGETKIEALIKPSD